MSNTSADDFSKMSPVERGRFIEQMKANPKIKMIIEDLEHSEGISIQQADDPFSVYECRERRMPFERESFLPYISTSPTALKQLQVFDNYQCGWFLLLQFTKQNIESDQDCNVLKSAFEAYSLAHLVDSSMYQQFHPPPNAFSLLEQFIERRPNDVFAKYFRVCMILHKRRLEVFQLEAYKEKIIEAEVLANKISHLSSIKEERMVLIGTYQLLGSMYCVTKQPERALDSFQKALDLDNSNIDTIYGVACQKLDTDVDGAIKLLHRYLDLAPKCDKKYPNAFYQLGGCYLLEYKNFQEALKYYKLGLRAEEERLPFIDKSHADIPMKNALEFLNKMQNMQNI